MTSVPKPVPIYQPTETEIVQALSPLYDKWPQRSTTLHLFAVGRIGGNRDIVIVPVEPDVTDAYTLGERDAENSLPCLPLSYYSNVDSIADYIAGWRAFTDHGALLDLDAQESDLAHSGTIDPDKGERK